MASRCHLDELKKSENRYTYGNMNSSDTTNNTTSHSPSDMKDNHEIPNHLIENLKTVIEKCTITDSPTGETFYFDSRFGTVVDEILLHETYKNCVHIKTKSVKEVRDIINMDNLFFISILTPNNKIEQIEVKFFHADKSFIVRSHDPRVIIPAILANAEARVLLQKHNHPVMIPYYIAQYDKAPATYNTSLQRIINNIRDQEESSDSEDIDYYKMFPTKSRRRSPRRLKSFETPSDIIDEINSLTGVKGTLRDPNQTIINIPDDKKNDNIASDSIIVYEDNNNVWDDVENAIYTNRLRVQEPESDSERSQNSRLSISRDSSNDEKECNCSDLETCRIYEYRSDSDPDFRTEMYGSTSKIESKQNESDNEYFKIEEPKINDADALNMLDNLDMRNKTTEEEDKFLSRYRERIRYDDERKSQLYGNFGYLPRMPRPRKRNEEMHNLTDRDIHNENKISELSSGIDYAELLRQSAHNRQRHEFNEFMNNLRPPSVENTPVEIPKIPPRPDNLEDIQLVFKVTMEEKTIIDQILDEEKKMADILAAAIAEAKAEMKSSNLDSAHQRDSHQRDTQLTIYQGVPHYINVPEFARNSTDDTGKVDSIVNKTYIKFYNKPEFPTKEQSDAINAHTHTNVDITTNISSEDSEVPLAIPI